MFVLRCLGVSLSCFLLLYVALSLSVMRGWRIVKRASGELSAQALSSLLLTLRILPFAVALLITLIFVIPSFLLLEPPVVAEPVGEIPLTLGVVCLLLLFAGALNALVAQRKTSRAVNAWLQNATTEPHCYPVPLFRVRPPAPALAVAGGLSPRVFLSDAAARLLDPPELETALKHEIAHVRRRDNLKKLLFRIFALPGMSALDTAWSEAAEMSADDAAVSNSREALDLASALIKLSRFAPTHPDAVLASGLAQPAGSVLNARIARLMAWNETRPSKPTRSFFPLGLLASLSATLCVMVTYGVALTDMHKVTEWLVR